MEIILLEKYTQSWKNWRKSKCKKWLWKKFSY